MRKTILIILLITMIYIGNIYAQEMNFISSIDTLGRSRAIFVDGDYAYLACDSVGLVIFDISIPEEPIEISYFEVPNTAVDISVQEGYAYLLDNLSGVFLLDISNPDTPIFISQLNYNGWYDKIVVYNSIICLSGYFDDQSSIKLVDVSDLNNPQVLSSIPCGCLNDIFIENDLLFTSIGECVWSSGCWGAFGVYDISNPSSPNIITQYDLGNIPCMAMSIEENIAYVGAGGRWLFQYFSELLVYDISEIINPIQIADLDIFSSMTEAIIKQSDYIFMIFETDGAPTFRAIDVSDSNNPIFVSEDHIIDPMDLFAINDLVFISGDISLQIFRFGLLTEVNDDFLLSPYILTISQNYPNPFNAQTTIQYSLSEQSDVTIEIYDIVGRKVDGINEGEKPAGEHQLVWNASDHPSGVYFYRIQAGDYAETKKMVLLR